MDKVFLRESGELAFIGKAATADFWSRHWEADDLGQQIRSCTFHELVVPPVRRHVPEGGRLLEGGCGQGQVVHALSCHGYRVTGVDYAESTVQAVNAACPELDVRAADVRHLPFDGGEFDGYISLGVIEHFWGGYGEIRDEMARVVKKGGFLLLSFPYMSPLRRAKASLNLYGCTLPSDAREIFYQYALDVPSVVDDFRRAGFTLVEKRAWDGIKGFKDEVCFGRQWLQDLYDGKRSFRYKRRLDRLLETFAAHMMLLVLERV